MTNYPEDFWCLEHSCWLDKSHLEKYHSEAWKQAVESAIAELEEDIYHEAGFIFIQRNDGFKYDG